MPPVASVTLIATGIRAYRLTAFTDRYLLTVALCQRDRELRVANAIVIGDFEFEWPLALAEVKLGQGLVRRGDLDLRRLVDHCIETVLALIGQRGRAGNRNPVQGRFAQQRLGVPSILVMGQRTFLAIVEDEFGLSGIRLELDQPAQPRSFRRLGFQG